MRLAGQAKGGYYAAHPDAIAHVLRNVQPPTEGDCPCLDPCAGEGRAIAQVAQLLNASPWGIELAEDRSETAKELFPERQFLVGTDFLRTRISHNSFSLIWTNPPFDQSNGNRVERYFIDAALPLLIEDGLLILVCPEDVADDWQTMQWFGENCYNVSVIEFPAAVRPYNEVAVLGLKRKESDWDSLDYDDLKRERFVYELPPGKKPAVFMKSEPTDKEVEVLLKSSTLYRFLHPLEAQRSLPKPPLAIGDGHIAMLLASGEINGILQPPGEPPHVVRGMIRKRERRTECTSEDNADGSTTTKTVYAEKIELLIRTVDHSGKIQTLTTNKEEEISEDE